jgi:hypothetical protein
MGNLREGARRNRYGEGANLQVTFSVTGLIPLLFAPRVNDSFRSKRCFAISSLAKGTSGVIATDLGPIPAAKGEPGTDVNAPLATTGINPEGL